jgi:hypothetical protein
VLNGSKEALRPILPLQHGCKPLSVSYERFAQILGFGEEDLGRPKLHGGEIPLDSEMAFMYDSMYGKVEFGTTHGMKPIYRMLNQLLCCTLTPKIGDNYNISNIAKDILVRMAPGKLTKGKQKRHGRLAMMPSVVILHPLQLPTGRDLSEPHVTESITWINI